MKNAKPAHTKANVICSAGMNTACIGLLTMGMRANEYRSIGAGKAGP